MKVGHHITAYLVAYAFGYTAYIFVAVVNLADTGRKRNRVNRLNNAFRHIIASAGLCVTAFIVIHFVCENLYIAVASEKDYLL